MAFLKTFFNVGPILPFLFEAVVSSSPALVPRTWNDAEWGCKCYLGDDCWPAESSWADLNSTVGGNLQVVIPPGAACYDTFEGPLGSIPTYDAAACADATAMWANETWTVEKPAAALWTYFTNDTCTPTENPSNSCTLGYYGLYVIMAETKEHIKAGVDFARENNLRLIIRNTGHDFIGRSTGWGSLVINTHSFQDVNFTTEYDGPGDYTGGAVTAGAGVQGRAFLQQAHAQDPPVTAVTGECPTVGVVGGLVQGGGHGPLTPLYGLVADNTLAFEVITADGEYVTANEEENPDLFWALKGGGPGAYGVVLSATFKTFPEQKASGVIVNINDTLTSDVEVFWEGVKSFHKYANRFVDAGLYAYFELMAMRLHIAPFVGIGKTAEEMAEILQPMFDEFEEKNIPYDAYSKSFDTLWDLYTDLFEDETAGTSALTGGWMFSHQDVEENNDGIIEAFRTVVTPREDLANQGFLIGHLWDAGHSTPVSNSATNPRFRQSTDFAIVALTVPVGSTLAQKADLQDVLTNVQDAAMKKAGPNGCAYINEGDPYQSDWQDHFWGPEYPKLYDIRQKWDPNGVFYNVATPGTEDWEVIEYGTRLCKKIDKKREAVWKA
ncbi:FAD-binding domain-containing protein [Xylariomycetidae sp. FL2044]|nr:FAD-binding domain-containing protein [Xylariomycetidae sp. FL2044]